MAEKTSSSSKTRPTVKPLILGGGLAGLATAMALKNRVPGIQNIQIWEASDEADFCDVYAGAGAQLGPNGLRALQWICGSDNDNNNNDILQQVMDAASPLRGNAMILPDGNVMAMPDTTANDVADGLPHVFVRWGVLRNLLLQALINNDESKKNDFTVTIQTESGRNVAGYRHLNDDEGHVQLIDANGDDLPHAPCNLIIGAEGVASTMRYLVNTQQQKVPKDDKNLTLRQAAKLHIRDTGRVNLKAIVRNDLANYFDNDEEYLENHTYAWFAPPESGLGLGCFCGPAGPGHLYWAISVADDAKTGKRFLEKKDQTNMHIEDIKIALLNLLQKAPGASEAIPFILQAITDTDANRIRVSRSEESTGMGPNLTSRDNRVVLVGDAAHAMSLSYGQNPNFALEDAAVLASCLQECGNDWISALQEYNTSRLERCMEMQQRSDERARKAMKGEATEDVSKWIFQWDVKGKTKSTAEANGESQAQDKNSTQAGVSVES